MSTNIYKSKDHFDCDNYKFQLILVEHNGSSTYSLYYTWYIRPESPKTTQITLGKSFDTSMYLALKEVLNMEEPNPDTLTEQEKSVIFKNN